MPDVPHSRRRILFPRRVQHLLLPSWAACLLLVLSGWAVANAEEGGRSGKTITLAPVHIQQLFVPHDDSDIEQLHGAVQATIVDDGRLIWADPPAMADLPGDVMGELPCIDRQCLVAVGSVVDVDLVLGVQIGGSKRSTETRFRLRLVDVNQDRVVEDVHGRGSEPNVLPMAEIRAELSRMLDQFLNPRATLTVDTDPAESTVLLNREPVGFAPVTVSLTAEIPDTVEAVRQGYRGEARVVRLSAGEQRRILLELRPEAEVEVRAFPAVHAFAIGGIPLEQASSNLDSRVSWGAGESFGARVGVGDVWRIGLGFLTYGSEPGDIDENQIGAVRDVWRRQTQLPWEDPTVEFRHTASLLHSNLYYYPYGQDISPYVGIGLGALQRAVRQRLLGIEEERKTDFEAAWMFVFGLEARVAGPVRFQVELTHVRALIESDAWRQDNDDDLDTMAWEIAFDTFSTFTVLRAGVGISF